MKTSKNPKILIGSVGFILTGLTTLTVAASYQGPYPPWLRVLRGSLFIVSALFWLAGFRETRKRSAQHEALAKLKASL